MVLGLCRRGLLDACKVRLHLREGVLSDLCPECGGTGGFLHIPTITVRW